jgi:ubiquinone biosynthesis protein COQ4
MAFPLSPLPLGSLRHETQLFVRTLRLMHGAGMPMFHPTRIAGGLKGIVQDPNDTRHVFTLFESMIGPIEVRQVGHFIESPEGRALFAKQPQVVRALADRDGLRRMPEGSLGRAYLAFVESEGITADGLVQASQEGRVAEHVTSPELAFLREYMRDTHDLWHTLTGYRGDIVGELALLAFGFAQMGNLGVGFLVVIALLLSGAAGKPGGKGLVDSRVFDSREVILGGFLRGLRARWVPTTDWLALLERPLDDVRRELAVGAAPTYEPVRA